MPYPSEHSARLRDPDRYEKFRRQNDKFGSGIHAIWGITGEGKAELQAIRFDASTFTAADAKKWLKEHGYKPIRFEPASDKKAQARGSTKYECECLDCGGRLRSEQHCRDIRCPQCGGEMRRVERPGPGQRTPADGSGNNGLEAAFSHNSSTDEDEPDWASVDKTKLPRAAFAWQGEPGKKSTWGYAHHWVKGGKSLDENGIYEDGVLLLHRQGLGVAYAAAMGARSGKKAAKVVIDHLERHRKDIGTGEKLAQSGVQLELEAAGRVRVHGVAYSGGKMKLSGWRYPVVVDLAGLEIPEKVPLLTNHENRPGARIGLVSAHVEGDRLLLEGEVLSSSEVAQGVLEQARAGGDWQLSIGAEVEESELVRGKREVNGQEQTGPFYCVTKAILREVSVLPVGADHSSKLQVAARFVLEGGNQMEFEKWLEAKGLDVAAMSEDKIAELKAQWEAEMKAKEPDPRPEAGDLKAAAVADLRKASAEESKRIARVRQLCAGKHPDIEAKAIEEGWDETKVELEVLRANRPKGLYVQSGTRDATPKILEAAIRLGGVEKSEVVEEVYDEDILERADAFRGLGLKRLIAISCELDGVTPPMPSAGDQDYLEAAFSTTTLSGILGNVANKVALSAYKSITSAARLVAQKLTANDFRTHTGYRLTGNSVFDEVGEGGELKHFDLNEQSYSFSVDTYGRILALTRQQIINDDLNVFTQIPQMFGRGAALKLESLFWTLVLANTDSFFKSGNGNLITATLGSSGLSSAVAKLMKQTDSDGNPIVLNPKFLVVPPELFATAQELYTSKTVVLGGTTKTPNANIHQGKYQPIPSPYLSNSNYTGYSTTAWYLFADPAEVAAFGIAYLRGNETPTFEPATLAGDVLGKGWRGYWDIGVCQIDHRGAVKSTGAG